VAVDLISAVVKDADYDDRRFVMQITSPNVYHFILLFYYFIILLFLFCLFHFIFFNSFFNSLLLLHSFDRNYYLQAENEGELNDWKNAITNASQHGPLNHDVMIFSFLSFYLSVLINEKKKKAPRNLPNSGSFASLTALPNQRTRPASDIIDESVILFLYFFILCLCV